MNIINELPCCGDKVIAVVVTYNRIALLKESLVSILNQTWPIMEIIVVDNASKDETEQFLYELSAKDPIFKYYRLKENTGGAGGFNFGLKKAYNHGAELTWIVDDDTYADPRALEYLIEAYNKFKGSFVCSNVVGKNNFPMNIPDIDFRPEDNGYPSWPQFLSDGVVKVRACTFVSVMIPRAEIKRTGFPIKEMFIWGDDGEYTHRLSTFSCGYLVGKSIVEHRRLVQKKINIMNDTDASRMGNFFYFYRNNFYISKKYKSKAQLIIFCTYSIIDLIKSIFKKRPDVFKIILTGLLKGVFFYPEIEHVPDKK